MGTKLQFNSAYHPQTDGQTKVVNWSLGNLLQSIIEEKPKQLDLYLPQEEFSYNSLVNRFIGKTLFQVVYGRNHMSFLNLVHLPIGYRIGDDGESFTKHIQQLQQQVRQKLQSSNEQNTIIKDAHQQNHILNEDDSVIVFYLQKERFPRGT